ncbi:ABC transporter permease [Fodinicola acaciae]|uniref:ABC transporter permease n=1 Tax=Fodinicola acaciae TaxID=2681555 RepID=UPI0013D7FEE2|nr:ABC transporter permease [Fodinicola acaciae]
MGPVLRVLVADLRQRPLGTLLPGLALAVGLACVVASVLVGGAYDAAIQRNQPHTPRGSAIVVRKPGSEIESSVVTELRQMPGIKLAQPRQVAEARLRDLPNEVSVRIEPSDPRLATTTILRGRLPANDHEVAIDEVNAGRHPIGSTVTLVDHTTGAALPAQVVGVSAQDLGRPGGIGLVATAGLGAHLDVPTIYGIDVVPADGIPVDTLMPRIQGTIGAEYEVDKASELRAQEKPGPIGVTSSFFVLFSLLALATAALVAGAAFRAVASARVRRTALLRALGASRPSLIAVSVVEAVIIGLVAAFLAVASGWFVAVGMLAGLNAVGVSALIGSAGIIPGPPSPLLAFIAVVLGVVTAVFAALRPAFQASGVPPVAALSAAPDAPVERQAGLLRVMSGVLLMVPAIGLVVIGLAAQSFFPLLLSAVLAMLGLFGALGPLVVPWLVRGLVGLFFLGRLGPTVRVAAREPSRTPRRAASVAMPLAGAFALLAFGAVGSASIRESLTGRDVATFDTASYLGWGLLGLSVLAAVSGVVATTAVSVTERRRELALSRALGVTRAGVGLQVIAEAVLLALATAVSGGLVGYAYGIACVSMMNVKASLVPPLPLLISVVAVTLLAVAAAAGPAIRGARLTPTSSLADT